MTSPNIRHAQQPRRDDGFYLDPAKWMPRLERLLDEQRELYESLERLSQRQAELIERDEMEALLGVLQERQGVIDRLSQANEQFEPFRSRWSELMASAPAARRDEFQRCIAELSELAGRIAQRDEDDRRALESRRQSVAGELRSVAKGRGAVAAYGRGQSRSDHARYQDRHG